MSLGWLTESTLMPRKGKEIEDVGKATMVDMRAALYQTESALKQPEGHASAALADQRRRRERRRDPLAASSNIGVGDRDAAASRQQREDEARVTAAMARKVAMYDAMARGEVPEETSSHGRSASSLAASASSLVDFELKQLRGDGDLLRLGAPSSTAADGDAGGRNGGDRGAPSLMSATMRREEERRAWEEAARREMDSTGSAVEAKRQHEEMSRETGLARASASDQRAKRQRALDERRATLRLKQEARSRASEEAAEGDAGLHAQEPDIEVGPPPPLPPPLPAYLDQPAPPLLYPPPPQYMAPMAPMAPPPPYAAPSAAAMQPAGFGGPPSGHAPRPWTWQHPQPPQPTRPPPPPPATGSDQEMMRMMGLPSSFTSTAQVEAEAEAAEETAQQQHHARVQEAWAAYNQQQGGMYAGQGRYGQAGYHHYEYPNQ